MRLQRPGPNLHRTTTDAYRTANGGVSAGYVPPSPLFSPPPKEEKWHSQDTDHTPSTDIQIYHLSFHFANSASSSRTSKQTAPSHLRILTPIFTFANLAYSVVPFLLRRDKVLADKRRPTISRPIAFPPYFSPPRGSPLTFETPYPSSSFPRLPAYLYPACLMSLRLP